MNYDTLIIFNESNLFLDSIPLFINGEIPLRVEIISEKSDFWSDILKNLIPIILAFLAGFAALFQVKANIFTSSRMKWIESFQQHLGIVSRSGQLAPFSYAQHKRFYKNANEATVQSQKENYEQESKKFYSEYFSHYNDLRVSVSILTYKLNPSKYTSHAELDEGIKELLHKYFTEGSSFGDKERKEINDILLSFDELARTIVNEQMQEAKSLWKL